MAIKVGGTTVVDDSRQLTNIASVDATTVAALGAAGVGGGGGVAEFTATGTISNGDFVGLQSDGTVKVITAYAGNETQIENTNFQYSTNIYDPSSGKIVVFYARADYGGDATAVVGTVNGTTITWGTPLVWDTNANFFTPCATIDPDNNIIVVSWSDANNSDRGYVQGFSVSGNTISTDSAVTLQTNLVYSTACNYDPDNNRAIVFYSDGNTGIRCRSVAFSGTSVTSLSPDRDLGTNITSVRFDGQPSFYDALNDRSVVLLRTSSTFRATYVTVNGTTITDSSFISNSNSIDRFAAQIHPSSGKILYAYRKTDSYLYIGYLDTTASSLSFSTDTIIDASQGYTFEYPSIVFYDTNKFIISFREGNLFDRRAYITGTFNGSTITFGGINQVNTTQIEYLHSTYHSTQDKVIFTYRNNNQGSSAYSQVFDPDAASTFSAYVGVAAENISDTASGDVNVLGGVNEGQTGLTAGQKYYLQNDATIRTSGESIREIGRALSSTKLLLTQGSIEL